MNGSTKAQWLLFKEPVVVLIEETQKFNIYRRSQVGVQVTMLCPIISCIVLLLDVGQIKMVKVASGTWNRRKAIMRYWGTVSRNVGAWSGMTHRFDWLAVGLLRVKHDWRLSTQTCSGTVTPSGWLFRWFLFWGMIHHHGNTQITKYVI